MKVHLTEKERQACGWAILRDIESITRGRSSNERKIASITDLVSVLYDIQYGEGGE